MKTNRSLWNSKTIICLQLDVIETKWHSLIAVVNRTIEYCRASNNTNKNLTRQKKYRLTCLFLTFERNSFPRCCARL